MSNLSAEAQQRIGQLKKQYIASFPKKINQLKLCWQNIESDLFSQESLDDLRAVCHKIAGSSGSYELLEISQAAYSLEQLCKQPNAVAIGQDEYKNALSSSYQTLVEMMLNLAS